MREKLFILPLLFGLTVLTYAQERDEKIRVLEAVAPIYPATAIATLQEGRTWVDAIIAPSGTVKSIEALEAPRFLQEVIKRAASRWRFIATEDKYHERKVRLFFTFILVTYNTDSIELLPVFKPPYEVEIKARMPIVSRNVKALRRIKN
jgi:hypothetical protein